MSHDAPLAMDYFIWVIKSATRTFVVNVGDGQQEEGERHGRTSLRSPADSLKLVGVDANDWKI